MMGGEAYGFLQDLASVAVVSEDGEAGRGEVHADLVPPSLGFEVSGLGFRVSGLGFRVYRV